MNRLTFAFLLLALFTAPTAFSQAGKPTAAEPPQLVKLRGERDAKIRNGLTTLHQRYLADLQTLQEQLTKAGNLDAAIAVRAEVAATRATLERLGNSKGDLGTAVADLPSGNWQVIFSSSDPRDWLAGKKRDCPKLEDVPDGFKFLRLRRLDTNQSVIIPMTKDRLTQSKRSRDRRDTVWWHGTNRFDSNAYHLGIGNPAWSADRGTVCIRVDGGHSRGWGFGHKAFENDGQCASWDGKEIRSRSVEFEVAVTKGPLALFEEKEVLGASE